MANHMNQLEQTGAPAPHGSPQQPGGYQGPGSTANAAPAPAQAPPAPASVCAWDRLPQDLRDRPQWMPAGWNGKDVSAGGGYKLPHSGSAHRLYRADKRDRAKWMGFEYARQCAMAQGMGLGLALSSQAPAPLLLAIDVDFKRCTSDAQVQELNNMAESAATYAERSQSGNGLRIMLYVDAVPACAQPGAMGPVEVYWESAYVVMTGNSLHETPRAVRTMTAQGVEQMVAHFAAAYCADKPAPAASSGSVATNPQTVTELRSALNAIPAEDRDVWVRVGMACKTLGESVGWGLWADWSQRSTKWDPQDAARTWDSFEPRDITHLSIFKLAQDWGWVNPGSNAAQITGAQAQGQWINGDYWPTVQRAPDALVMRTADTVVMQSIEWIWPGYIACEFLNLVVGETSAGKSTVLADVAARVTTGRPWPGEPEGTLLRMPGRVLWLGSEDPMELLTVPRLRACGADLQRVTEIQGVTRNGQRGTFSLQDDLAAVRTEIARALAVGEPYAMLIVDPVTSYLHGGKLKRVDMNDSGHLRTVLEPWIVLAAETGIAIVGVTHLAKDTTRSLLHRVLGGGAFAQLCRSLVAVVNRFDEGPYEKAILQVKSNLPDAQKGAWRFRTDQCVVGMSNRGRQVQANFPVWDHFDAALTPEALAGGARGPVSKAPAVFGLWVKSFFSVLPPDPFPIAAVRARALAENIVSEKWWNEHSSEYLEKRNMNGTWMCRPLA